MTVNKLASTPDPSHDIFRLQPHVLQSMFCPRSVAVVGASEKPGSVGRTIFSNMLSGGFRGRVYPINPHRSSILEARVYPNLASLPEIVDLVVVATPAQTVASIIAEGVALGIPSAVIISAGFKEKGPAGLELEQQIRRCADGKMRIIGPNCLGLMNPLIGLNATFAQTGARSGNVAFLSQSGALCTAILDWSLKQQLGFSSFVSTGSMLDVGWGDLIDYFGMDPSTRSIVIYMESVGDARSFLSAAREVSLQKPIIIIKAGRTEAAAKAAASHTGALTGSDEVLDAAFRRCGVLRVQEISDLFYMADILSKQSLPAGRHLGILTNAGGPGVLAADALSLGGGDLAALSPSTLQALNEFLPPHWSHANPIDILGDADANRYGRALEVVLQDPQIDGLLAVMTPQGMTGPVEVAKQLSIYAKKTDKPIFSSWMGGAEVQPGVDLLAEAGIPNFPFPDAAVRAFNYMWKYRDNLRALYETPAAVITEDEVQGKNQVEDLLSSVRISGRTLLTEFETKKVLMFYGIPTVPTELAESEEQAVEISAQMGFPTVVKLNSVTITHKSDVGGVRLNLQTPEQVRQAYREIRQKTGVHFQGVTVQPMIRTEGYELILGSSLDSQFGPVLLFGMGGQLVEVFRDKSLALPPLNTTLARRTMERTRIFKALQGVRGRPAVNLAALEKCLVRFSDLVVNHPVIKELDINPLLVSADQLIALDARLVLHAKDVAKLPRLAIRPYPSQYVQSLVMANGLATVLRPIRPEDEPQLVGFHHRLSRETIYARYFQHLLLDERIAHERLNRICFVDYDREMALVCERDSQIVAVGRMRKNSSHTEGELAVVIQDDCQRQGLGTAMMERLIQMARDEKLCRVYALMLPDNRDMRSICEKMGFEIEIRERDLLASKHL